jgi:hypothetical protein
MTNRTKTLSRPYSIQLPYWIMEGDTDYLRDEDLKFREIAEGAVGCLGDFTTPQMVEVCQRSFGVHIP